MRSQALVSALALAGLATSVPLLASRDNSAASIIKATMPTSDSCAGAQFPAECRTADQAAPFLIAAMQKYNLCSPGEIAGVLALMGFESVDMKFAHNVSPGRPGQGTFAMFMPNFVLAYAKSSPELADKAAAVAADPVAVLALVMPDQYNFGAAPWFLATQCSDAVRSQLQTSPDAGFQAYMGCVGVSATDDRLAYWNRAKAAFGI
jgi:hypothetical protein